MKIPFLKFLSITILFQLSYAKPAASDIQDNLTLVGIPTIAPNLAELSGDLSDGMQDLWLFTVSPDDALSLFSARVDGLGDTGGAIGFIGIERNDADEVTRRTDVSQSGAVPSTRDDVSAQIGPLMLEAGEYILGVTPLIAGQGNYRLRFETQNATQTTTENTGLAVGLWQGEVSDDAACFALPDGAADLAVWAPKGAALTVWIQDIAGVKHLRAKAAPVWQVSGIIVDSYQLCFSGAPGTPWVAQLALATKPESASEPDDTPDMPRALPNGGTVSGQIDARGSQRDTDTFMLPAGPASYRLLLTAHEGQKIDYELRTTAGTSVKSGSARSAADIAPIVAKEDLVLSLSGDAGTKYEISYFPYPTPQDGEKIEPNDTLATATIWPLQTPATGNLINDDSDFFQFHLDDPAQLWRLQADGAGVRRFTVYDVSNEVIAERHGNNTDLQRISNLYMIPGRYTVKVEGEGPYSLRILSQGPRRDDVEIEPNDDAQRLVIGQSLRGQLDPGDRDVFRFSVRSTEWLNLRVSPPLGETISVYMRAEGGEVFRKLLTGGQSTMDYTRAYQAGDYEIEIKTAGGISGLDDYVIALRPSDQPFGPLRDREPNDYAHSAENWPEDGRLVGSVGIVQQDRDAYRLRIVSKGADLRFCELPAEITVSVQGADGRDVRRTSLERTDQGTCLVYDDLAKGDHIVFLEQNSKGSRTGNPTDYVIAPTGQAAGEQGAPLPQSQLAITIDAAPPVPKSFVEGFEQHLPLAFSIDGYDALATLSATLAASEPNWAISALEITDQGNGRALVKTELIAPPELGESEIRVHLDLKNGGGRGVISQVFVPTPLVPVQSPKRAFAVPEPLLGGLNMASAQLGGRIVALDGGDLDGRDPDKARGANALIDGLAIASEEFGFRHVENGPLFNFDLGGDDIVPLAGLLLTPRGAPGASRTLKDFFVEASADGVTFAEVLRATLKADQVEQGFVFDQTVSARALRLVPLSSWTNDNNNLSPVRLGEFKAVAVPGWSPEAGSPLNIADPAFGGQVVWADPAGQIGTDWDRELLLDGDTRPSLVRDVDRISAVLGFHHSRAASVLAIDWTLDSETMAAPNAGTTDAITISASVEGPLGPWVEVAKWTSAGQGGTRIDFAQPIWARYLRFDMSTKTTADYLRIPEQIRVWEAASTSRLPSILGEWGEFSQASAYERDNAVTPTALPAPAGGATVALAVALEQDDKVASSVQRGVNADWWGITPPVGAGELRVTLDTKQQGGAHPSLFDTNGNVVALRRATEVEAEARGLPMPLYLAPIDENLPYDLRVEEPLRPIAIVWDTSGSTVPYKPAMDRALRDIALLANPDRDLIGFLPFGGSLLGGSLLGDPELLIRRLGNETATGDSSNAEAALVQAGGALKDLDGVRGIILITDAATNRDLPLWQTLSDVRPRIGALAIPSTGAFGRNPDRERDLMENWARASGGFYQYISTQADFSQGFARAVDKMRGPKPYQISISFGPFVPAPEGSLRAFEMPAEENSDQRTTSSVLILMDTSGSMLQRIDGKRRYQIAQTALAPLAQQANARGIAIGLRRFGIAPDACDTELLAPISRRSPNEFTDMLATIVPQNNARTPIAAALAQAGADLANAVGVPRIVILTDGEETCEGDPEQVISDLAAQGIAVRIDIVGFAIDDQALSATFTDWARVGRGQYINVSDSDALERALLDVSQKQFRVQAADGTETIGTVGGDALPLAAGRYTVVVEGRDAPLSVDILAGTESVIDLTE